MPTSVFLNEGAVDMNAGASYTPAALPVNGDSLSVVAGSQLVNTNPAALTAVNLVDYFHSNGFKGSMGVAGSPVEFGNITGTMQIDGGGGQHYFKTGTVASARVIGSGGGKVWLSGGTYTVLVVFGGEVEISGACTVTKLIVLGGTVTLQPLTSGAASTTIIIKGGTVYNSRSCATVELINASARLFTKAAAAVTTKLRIAAGVATHLSSGTITYLEGAGGTLSTRGAEKKFTITAGELWSGFTIDDSSQLTYITWGALPTLYGFKGGSAIG